MPSEQVSRLNWKWKKPFFAKIVWRERMRKQRKQYTAEEQVVIVTPLFGADSVLPWQKDLFETALQSNIAPSARLQEKQKRIEF